MYGWFTLTVQQKTNTISQSDCSPVKINKKTAGLCSGLCTGGHQRLKLGQAAGPWAPECSCAHRQAPAPHPSAARRQHRRGNSPDATRARRRSGTVTAHPASPGPQHTDLWGGQDAPHCIEQSSLSYRIQPASQSWLPSPRVRDAPHSGLEVFKAQNWTEMNKAASGLAEDGAAISL